MLACASAAVACGPEFPNRYYTLSDAELLAAPEGFFAAELARFAPARAPVPRAVQLPGKNPRGQTVEADIADLRQALAERGVASADRIGWGYESARRELESWVEQLYAADGTRVNSAVPNPPTMSFAPEIPAEFRLYLAGAVAWHQRRLDVARATWRALLELPEAERRYRTVWVAFMLGRLEVDVLQTTRRDDRVTINAAHSEARRRLRETRAAVSAGFRDPLGLAAASLGWEAKASLATGDFSGAIGLYFAQHAAGDATALPSLQRASRDALAAAASNNDYRSLARDEISRRVITAFLVAKGGPRFGEDGPRAEQLQAWAVALEQTGLGTVPDADRLAWLAYEGGLFALAERWAALAIDSPEAQWIRAKLVLRGGNLRRGEDMLRAAAAAPAVGDAHRRQILAELGRVCLAQDNFNGALAAALEGRHWEDAAFVAERVMAPAELVAFVEAQPAGETAATAASNSGWNVERPQEWLRHLLARRLARAGKLEQAARYFPAQWREAFQAYATDTRTGFDVTRATAERASAFWRAAQAIRAHGMELLGTELEPDWAIWEGNFGQASSVAERRAGPANAGGVFAPTPVEQARWDAHEAPTKRFHYRYRAAELAWWAAALLPNDSDETARILATAGGWLKARDPQAAQPFYQALVIRCGNTALGRAAAAKHWFPAAPARDGD